MSMAQFEPLLAQLGGIGNIGGVSNLGFPGPGFGPPPGSQLPGSGKGGPPFGGQQPYWQSPDQYMIPQGGQPNAAPFTPGPTGQRGGLVAPQDPGGPVNPGFRFNEPPPAAAQPTGYSPYGNADAWTKAMAGALPGSNTVNTNPQRYF